MGQELTRTNLQIHFVQHHMQDTIVILKEVNCPHPHLPICDMFVPWGALNHCHPITTIFMQGSDKNIQRLVED